MDQKKATPEQYEQALQTLDEMYVRMKAYLALSIKENGGTLSVSKDTVFALDEDFEIMVKRDNDIMTFTLIEGKGEVEEATKRAGIIVPS